MDSEILKRRIMKRVVMVGDCWQWTGCLVKSGYGRVFNSLRSGPRVEYAHRFSYRLFIGEIPKGLTIDHLCRNRACVNPDHLEVVSQAVNTLRGFAKSAINARRTHCKRGHIFDEDNTWRESTGARHCRACHAIRGRKRRKEHGQ